MRFSFAHPCPFAAGFHGTFTYMIAKLNVLMDREFQESNVRWL